MKKTNKEKQKKTYCFSNTHSNFEIFYIFGLQNSCGYSATQPINDTSIDTYSPSLSMEFFFNPERMKTEEA